MKLYKYFSAEGIPTLENGFFKFTPPNEFNDPFELRPVLSGFATERNFNKIIEKEIRNSQKQFPFFDSNALEAFVRDKFKELEPQLLKQSESVVYDQLKNIGILCLTENENSELMWSHYANSHQGFLVEFDKRSPFFDQRKSDDDLLRKIRPVEYLSQRKKLILENVKGEELYIHKSMNWVSEREWRMGVALIDADSIVEVNNNKIYLFKYPFEMITRVVVGVNCSSSLRERIVRAHRSNFPHAEVLQAELDSFEYKINYVKL